MYFVHDGEFSFSRCFRRFLSVCGVNRFSPGRWALLEGFRVFDGPSLHLIVDQKVRFMLISNAGRYAMKGSLFFLLMKFFTVCFISTFYFKKNAMTYSISSLCVCKGHLHFFHFVCSVCARHLG